MSKTNTRVSPALQVVRQFVVRALAGAGTPTTEIAKALGLSRSYTIKQATIALKPRTAAEKRILKVAAEHEAKLKRAGVSGLLGGEDITTTLAGGERPKLGPLKARQEKRAKKAPAKKVATPKAPAKRRVKTNSVVEAVKALPKEKPAPTAKARVRKLKPKASDLKAPLPAQKLSQDAHEESAQATMDDILGDVSTPPDAPI